VDDIFGTHNPASGIIDYKLHGGVASHGNWFHADKLLTEP
jgi:hypothetical protein